MSRSTTARREPTTGQSPAAAQPTDQQAQTTEVSTIEKIEQRLGTFLHAANALRNRIEHAMRDADQATRQADEAYLQAGALERAGEVDRSHELLRQIKGLRATAVQLRQSVGPMVEDLPALVEEERALRADIQPFIEKADVEIRLAQQRRVRVLHVHAGISDHCLSNVRDLLDRWRKLMGRPEPQPAPAPQAQAAAESLPLCPRCKRNFRNCVKRVGDDRFTCDAVYHGKLTFTATGRVIEQRQPNMGAPKRRIGAAVAVA